MKEKIVTLRMPDQMKKAIDELAFQEDLTASQLIRRIMRDGLKEKGIQIVENRANLAKTTSGALQVQAKGASWFMGAADWASAEFKGEYTVQQIIEGLKLKSDPHVIQKVIEAMGELAYLEVPGRPERIFILE